MFIFIARFTNKQMRQGKKDVTARLLPLIFGFKILSSIHFTEDDYLIDESIKVETKLVG